MKIRALPSSYGNGDRQFAACMIVDGCVAIDAGCLANSVTSDERRDVRDVVLTHAHLDHIAGLPLFVDDLFSELEQPIRIHATESVVEVLEQHVFNWQVYPRFSELSNDHGPVMEYKIFEPNSTFNVSHLKFSAIPVNHRVESTGFIVGDGDKTIAITGDTAENDQFWVELRNRPISALFIECAFPDKLASLAKVAHHLTPSRLNQELQANDVGGVAKYIINIKAAHRETVIRELTELEIPGLRIMPIGDGVEL